METMNATVRCRGLLRRIILRSFFQKRAVSGLPNPVT